VISPQKHYGENITNNADNDKPFHCSLSDITSMKVFLLYSLFLLPLCHVSAMNSYMEQNSAEDYALVEPDTLYIEKEETDFEIIYRLCFYKHDKRYVVFELKTTDCSSIDFVQSYKRNGVRRFDCFAVYDNVADGNRFLFFDYESWITYITPTCFSGFYPICSSVNFSNMEVLLENEGSKLKLSDDTLCVASEVSYLPFSRTYRMIKAKFVPYLHIEKEMEQHTCTPSTNSWIKGWGAEIGQEDLSGLFAGLTLTGIWGEGCGRIDIRLEEAHKTGRGTYTVKGASRIRLSVIRLFRGTIRIDSILGGLGLKDECINMDGFVYGCYVFREYGADSLKTYYCGHFRQVYRNNEQRVEKGRNDITELRMNLSEYTGHRQAADGRKEVCSWADAFIPGAPKDFCVINDAGEWVITPKYRKEGWDNLYDAYFNDSLTDDEVRKARLAEEGEWWPEATDIPFFMNCND
jgi:hypothetical protein